MPDMTVDSDAYAALLAKVSVLESAADINANERTALEQSHATAISKYESDLSKAKTDLGASNDSNAKYKADGDYRARIQLVSSVMGEVEKATGQKLDPSFLRPYNDQINAIDPAKWETDEQSISDTISKTVLEKAWKDQSDMFSRHHGSEAAPFVEYGQESNFTPSQTPSQTQVPNAIQGKTVQAQVQDPVSVMNEAVSNFGSGQSIL